MQTGGSQNTVGQSLRSSEGFCPVLFCLCFFVFMWFLKPTNSSLENMCFGFVQVSIFCSAHSAVYSLLSHDLFFLLPSPWEKSVEIVVLVVWCLGLLFLCLRDTQRRSCILL